MTVPSRDNIWMVQNKSSYYSIISLPSQLNGKGIQQISGLLAIMHPVNLELLIDLTCISPLAGLFL